MHDSNKTCKGRDLAKILRTVRLSKKEAEAWRRDLRAARKLLVEPKVRW